MEKLENSLKYRQWLKALESNNIIVNEVKPLHLVHKPNGELLFGLVHVDAQDSRGEKLLPIALIRGHFVSVLTVLIAAETQQKYLLLVRQYRIANGEYSYEHPAGMCDSQTDPYYVALKEVEEETGLKIEPKDLVLLNEKLLYSSPGLLDEGGYYFYCEIILPQAEIDRFSNKQTGAQSEREFITTYVCPIDQAPSLISSSVSMLNLLLYQQKKN
ncbi:MAG: NUDIX hydrolase [Microscillaceae bacterium]|nr:NUDIX hydrolase [Microscillaceae bacterium]MDW8461873.1 NUDIX hydrolase [Cytophagales bacterium]